MCAYDATDDLFRTIAVRALLAQGDRVAAAREAHLYKCALRDEGLDDNIHEMERLLDERVDVAAS